MFKKILPAEVDTLNFGKSLAEVCDDTAIIYLSGQLGAGKTTLIRGFLRGMGYQGHVKSPTYTLVEPYELSDRKVFHFDLYRLKDPHELEYIGIQDYFIPHAICLVEWPEYGQGVLPLADLSCYIALGKNDSREVQVEAHSPRGKLILQRFKKI